MNRNDPFYIRTPEEFRHDIGYQGEPLRDLTIHESQTEKVARDGHLVPYLGDTVIFELAKDVRETLAKMRDALYARCGDMLCEPLPDESFHITLHDLLSTPATSWDSRNAVFADLENRTKQVEYLLSGFRNAHPDPIRLRPTYMFNMVRKSVVLGFEPADDASHYALMRMYSELQHIVQLGYGLTPHVTIAYYKPADTDEYGKPIRCNDKAVAALSSAMQEIPGMYPLGEICVTTEKLHHRGFWDMRRYIPMEEFWKDYQNEFHALDLFNNQMRQVSSDLNIGNSFYSVAHKYAICELNLPDPPDRKLKDDGARRRYMTKQTEKRFHAAVKTSTLAAEKGFLNDANTRPISCAPEYESQPHRDLMAAVILMNLRERRLLPKRFSAFSDAELIYYCLYEQKW